MIIPDFLGYLIGGGQLALLLAIFQRLGQLGQKLENHEQRITRLEGKNHELA